MTKNRRASRNQKTLSFQFFKIKQNIRSLEQSISIKVSKDQSTETNETELSLPEAQTRNRETLIDLENTKWPNLKGHQNANLKTFYRSGPTWLSGWIFVSGLPEPNWVLLTTSKIFIKQPAGCKKRAQAYKSLFIAPGPTYLTFSFILAQQSLKILF